MTNPKKPKPAKPYAGFPLFAHANGLWAKKICGRLYYFGPWDDPEGALEKFNHEWPMAPVGKGQCNDGSPEESSTSPKPIPKARQKSTVTPEIVSKARQMLASGATLEKVAKHFGISASQIWYRVGSVKSLRGTSPRANLSKHSMLYAARDIAKGEPLAQLHQREDGRTVLFVASGSKQPVNVIEMHSVGDVAELLEEECQQLN